MTDKQTYSFLLREIECLKEREHCSRKCSSCPWGENLHEVLEGLNHMKAILKARSPELYFADDLVLLEEIIENGDQNKEVRQESKAPDKRK